MRDILARDYLAFCTMGAHQSSCHDWKIASTTTTTYIDITHTVVGKKYEFAQVGIPKCAIHTHSLG